MKNLIKSLVSFILISGLMIQPLTAFSANEGYDEDILNAGKYLINVMQFINDTYVGSDVSTDEMLDAAIYGITEALDDYSTYFTMEEYKKFVQTISSNVYSVGFNYQKNYGSYPVVISVLSGTKAEKAGIKANDEIISVNGVDTKKLSIEYVEALMTSDKVSKISLKLKRDGKELDIPVELEELRIQTVYSENISSMLKSVDKENDNKVAYIRITAVSDGTAEDFKKTLEEVKKKGSERLILDLRSNPGGILDQAVDICKQLVPEGLIVTIKDKEGNVEEIKSELKESPFKKIVVLTDGITASASELITSALQDTGAIVVGEKTYGKGVIQTSVPLENGVLKLTAYEYFSRNGNKINKVGISPNIKIDTVKFVSEQDTIDSLNVKEALKFVGYKAESKDETIASLKEFQTKNNITASGEIDSNTRDALNMEIYTLSTENDKVLQAGYQEAIK